MFVSSCMDESVEVRGVFDDLDKALEEHKNMGLSEFIVACNIGYPMEVRYLTEYSKHLDCRIKEERIYLENKKYVHGEGALAE